MKYARICNMFFGQPWALEEGKFRVISSFLRRKASGAGSFDEDVAAAVGQRRAGGYGLSGNTAVIQIFGTIANRLSLADQCSGGTSYEEIGSQLDAAMADKQVRKIVMQIDSNGGACAGCQEIAAKLRDARASKKIVAVCDPMAASAAYYLASQASECYVTPSGLVGSIGVIAQHVDESEALAQKGFKVNLITAGKYKGEGHPAVPLSDDARANMQKLVDSYYDTFITDVAKGRNVSEATVRNGYGQGQMLTAKEALAAGMVDGIRTFESVMSKLGAPAQSTVTAAAAQMRARAIELQ